MQSVLAEKYWFETIQSVNSENRGAPSTKTYRFAKRVKAKTNLDVFEHRCNLAKPFSKRL
jgi:hypothetical protein